MTRDLDRLATERFDLLVIGGGIHGLAAARDAARRGLRVALVERDDFGSGASFNHQRTVHGGLRALQRAGLRRVREGIRERRALARLAPHYLRPLPFITGIYGHTTRGRAAMRLALRVFDTIGRDRNAGVTQELHLPASRLESRTATARLFPLVRVDGLRGGAVWYDYQMVQADRLTFAFALGADAAGAVLVNHAEAVAFERDGAGRVTGARVVDRVGSREVTVHATAVLAAAGSGTAAVTAMAGIAWDIPLVRAMNLLTTRAAADIGLAAAAPGGRMLTLVGWRGRALVGTSQGERTLPSGAPPPDRDEVLAFAAEVNAAFPALRLDPSEIALVHHALVPAAETPRGPDLKPEPEIRAHADDGAPGLFSLLGVKYTTARLAAERAVDRVLTDTAIAPAARRPGVGVLPTAGIADVEAIAVDAARRHGVDLPGPVARHLSTCYGSGSPAVIALMAERPLWRQPLGTGTLVLGAEIAHAALHEQALRLTDAVLRRTTLGAMDHPGDEALRAAAAIMADIHGWDAARVAAETEQVERRYWRAAPTAG